jgi:transposase-like protein
VKSNHNGPVVAIDIDGISYPGKHWRVNDKRGWAGFQHCVDCPSKADQWSQIRGTSGLDPDDYEPRCKSCHNKYDWRTGNYAKLTLEQVKEIRDMYKTGKWYQRELAETFGVKQSTISVIVNDKTWSGNAYQH